jgi:hypothetical protein
MWLLRIGESCSAIVTLQRKVAAGQFDNLDLAGVFLCSREIILRQRRYCRRADFYLNVLSGRYSCETVLPDRASLIHRYTGNAPAR